jgi:hypothetical protein
MRCRRSPSSRSKGVGDERADRSSERRSGANNGWVAVAEDEASATASAIDAASPQPHHVASTIPRTSPMPHPVRQWFVALQRDGSFTERD